MNAASNAHAASGRYERPQSGFRRWISREPEAEFPAESGRYHLYVGLLCPWATRTLIARALKKLERHVGLSIVEPFVRPEGWSFGDYPGATRDNVHGVARLREVYRKADPEYAGKVTIPVLWDRRRGTIVSNESADILRMFDTAFIDVATPTPLLRPPELEEAIESLNERLHLLNDGVYRAGFATSQTAYEEAVADVFGTLEGMEDRLATAEFLLGPKITEPDLRLFVTLVRFDVVYHGLFKCNLRRIADYPNLSRYLRSLLRRREFASAVDLDHIKRGYYSMVELNPTGTVPAGPALAWSNLLRPALGSLRTVEAQLEGA